MNVVLTGVISELTQNFDDVEIRSDSSAWFALQQLAREKFGAELRLEYHATNRCSCCPGLVAILPPPVGHYAIIGEIPIIDRDIDDVCDAYIRFLTPQLAILEHWSILPREGR